MFYIGGRRALLRRRTNFLFDSGDQSTGNWTRTNINVAASGSVPGGFDITATANNGRLTGGYGPNPSHAPIGVLFIVSIWAKTTASDVVLRAFEGGTGAHNDVAIDNSNVLKRYFVARPGAVGSSNLDILIGTTGEVVTVKWAQLELRQLTGYIPTKSQAVTRWG
jgi:hypothetical protein